ncbi:nucleoside permease [Salmonella enterica subsp. enterica]|uniref:Nucleoside permease n=1 Tax=Salmonella enterica I TaxID=59201 RepID=A0A3S4LTR0_SALET|nr:nucleoside permease [Salmonella enterica subsp. enterica]
MGITSRFKSHVRSCNILSGGSWLVTLGSYMINTLDFNRRECRYGLQLKRTGSDYHAGYYGDHC